MFTGLVAEMGRLRSVARSDAGMSLVIETTLGELVLGESIAVDGVCLTVARIASGAFEANASNETLAKSTMGGAAAGQRVHLERALTLADRLGGHLVTGHVDGVGSVVDKRPDGDALRVTYEAPAALAALIAPKGAITIDGVSLTVNEVDGARFGVALVPFTRAATTLEHKAKGAPVNLEVDILAKYVARLLGKPGVDGTGGGFAVTMSFLKEHGFA